MTPGIDFIIAVVGSENSYRVQIERLFLQVTYREIPGGYNRCG